MYSAFDVSLNVIVLLSSASELSFSDDSDRELSIVPIVLYCSVRPYNQHLISQFSLTLLSRIFPQCGPQIRHHCYHLSLSRHRLAALLDHTELLSYRTAQGVDEEQRAL
jgi:hypothetical protein